MRVTAFLRLHGAEVVHVTRDRFGDVLLVVGFVLVIPILWTIEIPGGDRGDSRCGVSSGMPSAAGGTISDPRRARPGLGRPLQVCRRSAVVEAVGDGRSWTGSLTSGRSVDDEGRQSACLRLPLTWSVLPSVLSSSSVT